MALTWEDKPLTEDELVYRNVRHHFSDDLKFGAYDSECLADAGADWHEAEELLARGCTHEIVVALLLPL